MTLAGRVALVTGAGRGIGRAAAEKLAAEGALLVVNDLDEGPAKETVEAIEAAGGTAVVCAGSVTEADLPERLVATAVDTYGGIDVVVNNAGIVRNSYLARMSDEHWSTVLDVHLTAPFRILRAAQPVLSAAARAEEAAGRPRHRKVVNVSSIVGTAGSPSQANYASAKAGLLGLTRTLAKEWGRYRVNVNAVAFGIVDTRMTREGGAEAQEALRRGAAAAPLARAGTPEEAAGAVWMLCAPESDYVTGQVLLCGGGLTSVG
ncbi:SDR family NAD(P)-dependent oxidoreductase [Pseudonocardia pini]|uniref:SDR family NAD(P)-dependent oxidoreductase n=1 Tax=Pseudonocardia pini TaxID=2758030 RepID=UPI0015EFDE2D|nr:SDR family oxidoreductase [Pseudonocardia pini]